MFCDNTYTGVNSCLLFHTCTDDRRICQHKRYRLTLHVGTHQSTVGIIVLKERNHRCSNREDHTRRNVHKIHFGFFKFGCFFTITTGNIVIHKISVRINWFVGLCNRIVIFFISCQINNLICYTRILRICFIQNTIWCLNKAVLINTCIRCQRVDQTDVRTFRCLDRTHSSVMGVMYVSYLETGSVS